MKNRLVIIPAFNEAGCIVNTVEDIRKNAPSFDYVVINDCSLDETQQLCEEHRYNLINLPINSGIGAAVQTGYLYALDGGYDIAVQMGSTTRSFWRRWRITWRSISSTC